MVPRDVLPDSLPGSAMHLPPENAGTFCLTSGVNFQITVIGEAWKRQASPL